MKILVAFLSLLLADLYIIIFKKILKLYTKRINLQRKNDSENLGIELPSIKYPESFINKISILIVICCILSIIINWDSELNFINLFINNVTIGIGLIAIASTFIIIIGKIKRFYYQIKYDDPLGYLIRAEETEEAEEQ